LRSASDEKNLNEKLGLEGLEWIRNYFIGTGIKSYTLVANKGPIVSDLLYFENDKYFTDFNLQIGQVDRFTFVGDINQSIKGEFIDCRIDSPTLHEKVCIEFHPDPRKHLYIERGIAKRFEGLNNVTIRSEPILFATKVPNGYNIGNDRILFKKNTLKSDVPAIYPNKLPLPNEAIQFLLKREQEYLKENKNHEFQLDAVINGENYRLNLKPKEV
jgi:hypothetical protein